MAFKESATGKWTAQWYENDVYGMILYHNS